MAQLVFNRYEKKYLMPEAIYQLLRARLSRYMETDSYGLHTICNIYYDTADDLLIRRSLEHPVYKEKLRVRSYGVPDEDSQVFVEIKKKYKGIVNKRRVQMRLPEAMNYLDGETSQPEGSQINQEIDFFLKRYRLLPRLYLAYDRVALFGKEDPEFRVTFDRRIRYRREAVRLEAGDQGEYLLPEGWVLMESKIQGAAPLWFSQLLSELSLYQTSFSKYGNIYRKEHGAWNPKEMMLHRFENWNHLLINEEKKGKSVC